MAKTNRKPIDYLIASVLMAGILYVIWLLAINGPFSAETNAGRAVLPSTTGGSNTVAVNYGPFLLIPGFGSLAVVVYAIILTVRYKLPRPYVGQGMVAWIGIIFFQSFITGVVNPDIHRLLVGWGFNTVSLSIWDGLLVGAINALVVGSIAAGPLKAGGWRGAVGFGVGYGTIATLTHSVIYLVANAGILTSGRVPLGSQPELDALNSNPLVGLALVLQEAIFIAIYVGLSVLVFYAIKRQQAGVGWLGWLGLATLYYGTIMALTTGVGFGSKSVGSLELLWPVTLASVLWAALGWVIAGWLRPRFPTTADDGSDLAWEARRPKPLAGSEK